MRTGAFNFEKSNTLTKAFFKIALNYNLYNLFLRELLLRAIHTQILKAQDITQKLCPVLVLKES